jgi:hypothetical protein
MRPRRTPKSPAFRAHAFAASVAEGVWPACNPSRLHRSLIRHGRRVSYERIGTDHWQLEGGLWPASEAEIAELEACQSIPFIYPDGLPF